MFPVIILLGRKSAQQGLRTSRLPTFSLQEKIFIKGTSDFLGIGHFTTRYILQKRFPFLQASSYHTDHDVAELVDPKWPAPGPEWLYSVPWGFRRLLNFIKVITEEIFKILSMHFTPKVTICETKVIVFIQAALNTPLFAGTVWEPSHLRDREWSF